MKNIKVIVHDGDNETVDDLMGGMSLIKGEIVNYTNSGEVIKQIYSQGIWNPN